MRLRRADAESAARVDRGRWSGRGAFDWCVRRWPVLLPMLIASVLFGNAVRMYSTIPLWSDARGYSVSAWRLVNDGLLNYGAPDIDRNAPPSAYITPGYPLFLSGFYLFAGDVPFERAAEQVHPAVLSAQLALAVATVGLIAACGALVGGAGLAVLSGVLASLYLPFGWSASVALSETLGVFLLSLQLLVALRLADRDPKVGYAIPVAFGAVSALVALTRPAFALWPILPFVYLAIARRHPMRSVARWAAVALVAFVLVMSPWWIRNAVSLHAFIPLSSNTGTPMLDSTGSRTLTSEERSVYDRAKAAGRNAEGAVARFRLTREWSSDPKAFLRKRLVIAGSGVWGPHLASDYRHIVVNGKAPDGALQVGEAYRIDDPGLATAEDDATRYHHALVILGLLSVFLVRRWPRLLLVAGVPLYTVAVHTAILFINRYFLPAMPAVILLAAAAMWGTGLLVWRLVQRLVLPRLGIRAELPTGPATADVAPPIVPTFSRAGTRGRAFVAALCAAGVVWVLLCLLAPPKSPFAIELGSDLPVSGSVSYDTVLPWARRTELAIAPEWVSPQGAPSRELTVTLLPLGKFNPDGVSDEVWLYSVTSAAETVDETNWDSLALPPAWERKGSTLLWPGGEKMPLSIPLESSGFVDLEFLRHRWSGGVRVTVDGVSRDVDLHSVAGGRSVVRMLTSVPLEVDQRLDVVVPDTARSLTLRLTDGPRLVRISGASWGRRQPWSWSPQTGAGFELGQGVTVVERREDGLLLRIDGESGDVTIRSIGSGWPVQVDWGSMAFIVALSFVLLGAYEVVALAVRHVLRALPSSAS